MALMVKEYDRFNTFFNRESNLAIILSQPKIKAMFESGEKRTLQYGLKEIERTVWVTNETYETMLHIEATLNIKLLTEAVKTKQVLKEYLTLTNGAYDKRLNEVIVRDMKTKIDSDTNERADIVQLLQCFYILANVSELGEERHKI